MRKVLAMMVMAVVAGGVTLAYAADDKTIEGMAQCAKCALKEEKTCQNVVVVTEDGKEVKYYLVQNDVAKKAHQSKGFCTAAKGEGPKVKVTGGVEKKDDKMMVTATAIEAVEE
jgi:hypothetical protein